MQDSTIKPTHRGYEALFAEWAESQGWDVTKRGWPDFICRRDGALMAVEVKGGADDLSPEQIDTLNDLSAAGLPTYVYHHGLGLKRWRGRKPESVANLKAEISDLHELIRKIVQMREGMVPGIHRPVSPEWNMEDELNVVIEWCLAGHAAHERSGTRMTHCAWVFFLRKYQRLEWEEIASMVGGYPMQAKGAYRAANRVVEKKRSTLAAASAA